MRQIIKRVDEAIETWQKTKKKKEEMKRNKGEAVYTPHRD
jgi:hypothetical protein